MKKRDVLVINHFTRENYFLKRSHFFSELCYSFESCYDILSKLIGRNIIQSLELIFKDSDANIYFDKLEKLLISQNNIYYLKQLILHNRLSEFDKDKLENFVNNVLLNNKSLRILKIIGFEISNMEYNERELDENDQDLPINDITVNNSKSILELAFDFDVKKILSVNKKIKILSVSHDKNKNTGNDSTETFEKFYICKTKELAYEIIACRYLSVVRKHFLPSMNFFNKIKGFIRKYLMKFFPIQIIDIRNDFVRKYINYEDNSHIKTLPDHIIAKIERIGFDKNNIFTLNIEDFLELLFTKHV